MSLDSIGFDRGIDQSSQGNDYLEIYEELISKLEAPRRIVIVGATKCVAVANTFAEFLPNAEILLLRLRTEQLDDRPMSNVRCKDVVSVREMHSAIAGFGPVDILIEDGLNTKQEKSEALRELIFHVRKGGYYVVEDLHAIHLPQHNSEDGPSVLDTIVTGWSASLAGKVPSGGGSAYDLHFSQALESIRLVGSLAIICKAGNHFYKMRNEETSLLSASRMRVLVETNGGSFQSRASVVTNSLALEESRFRKRFSYPAAQIREYTNVVCSPGQVYLQNNVVLPDTFRKFSRRILNNTRIRNVSLDFAGFESSNIPFLRGVYYALDNEFEGHFGHIVSESLSKIWGWSTAKKEFPEIKMLISRLGGNALASWEYELLNAFGVEQEDVEIVGGVVRVDRLVAATQLFDQPSMIDPMILEQWETVGRAMRAATDSCPVNYPAKIFIGRRFTAGSRNCRNANSVEKIFLDKGYSMIYPEDYSIREQVALFSGAREVAGYAGSGMFSLMFAGEPKDLVLVIGSESYDAVNEYLIASVVGGRFAYVWGESDIKQPSSGWSERAFHSDFLVNLDRDGDFLRSLVS